jgi:hypothetical protein
MPKPSPRVALCVVAAAAVCCGCSSIFTRGMVDDGHGKAVGGAVVRVYDENGGTMISLDRTDANGCFLVRGRAPRGAKRFTLDVEAPGFRAARQDFALGDDLLIAQLSPDSDPGTSRIHVASYSERTDRWIPACAPPATMGSDSLTPN